MEKMIFLCPIALLFIAGCASSTQNLQRESARSIGKNLKPSDITIYDVDRGATYVDWKARTPNGATYRCSADDMVRRVNCTK